jgi:hypothetical protein
MWRQKNWKLLNDHLWIQLNGKTDYLPPIFNLGASIGTMGIHLELVFFDIDIWWAGEDRKYRE